MPDFHQSIGLRLHAHAEGPENRASVTFFEIGRPVIMRTARN